jgi:TRAP-type mannitol/chloroaromatic compound transport system permease small subunit
MVLSFLRVEDYLIPLFGKDFGIALGRPNFRGTYVHFPIMLISLIIAYFTRTLGFLWLSVLVVIAEFQIVLARFIFSYEQTFMGDLVRFWYGSLFLFASSYALIHEGHVRVDVLYTKFTKRSKAWSNALGSLLLGVPICWTVLLRGMWCKQCIINAPLTNFETSMSGYGMYVKYLMAGFLAIYALTMLIQFVSYFLSNASVLQEELQVSDLKSANTIKSFVE